MTSGLGDAMRVSEMAKFVMRGNWLVESMSDPIAVSCQTDVFECLPYLVSGMIPASTPVKYFLTYLT